MNSRRKARMFFIAEMTFLLMERYREAWDYAKAQANLGHWPW